MAENIEIVRAFDPNRDLSNTPMIDRAMRQIETGQKTWVEETWLKNQQPSLLLTTVERSLRDVYEWACEQRGADQGLLYDLNTAIGLIERCAGRVKS